MPELAEVEFYHKVWKNALGTKIACIYLHPRKRIFRGTDVNLLRKALTGSCFNSSMASGKHMLFGFDSGAWLGIHLGMTGKLSCQSADYSPGAHDHLILFSRDQALVFTDPRLFGRVRFAKSAAEPDWWANRPPDILSPAFTYSTMLEKIGPTRRPVKAVLLDQNIFPGIGNWMADEILWRSRIRPDRPWNRLTTAESKEIWKRTRQVCRDALRVIGTDWNTPPDTWLFNHRWKNGGTCPKTKKPLIRQQIAGRTTCYSPTWQK